MDTVMKKQTTSILRAPLEDSNSKFLRNTATHIICYPNLDHIMFIHQWANLKQENIVDGSCWKKWITSSMLCS